jgi:cytochrome c-type biogenesis protein CcmH
VTRIDPALEIRRCTAEALSTAGSGLDAQGKALLEEDLRSPCTEEIAVFHAFAETVAQGGNGVGVRHHVALAGDSAWTMHSRMQAKQTVLSRVAWSAVARLLLVLACWFAAGPARADATASPDQAPAPGEVTLERRLLAPCCWNQTLDIHESDLAASLRHEIRARLRAGEPQSVIEDDLAARYGERIRAVERGHDPGGAMPFLVGFSALVTGAGLVALLRRWRRVSERVRSREDVKISGANVSETPEDIRLDDELRALDD